MNRHKTKSPITDPLLSAIADSDLPMLQLAKQSGVARGSLIRFVRGESSLRTDCADKLAAFFNLELQPTAKTKGR